MAIDYWFMADSIVNKLWAEGSDLFHRIGGSDTNEEAVEELKGLIRDELKARGMGINQETIEGICDQAWGMIVRLEEGVRGS